MKNLAFCCSYKEPTFFRKSTKKEVLTYREHNTLQNTLLTMVYGQDFHIVTSLSPMEMASLIPNLAMH